MNRLVCALTMAVMMLAGTSHAVVNPYARLVEAGPGEVAVGSGTQRKIFLQSNTVVYHLIVNMAWLEGNLQQVSGFWAGPGLDGIAAARCTYAYTYYSPSNATMELYCDAGIPAQPTAVPIFHWNSYGAHAGFESLSLTGIVNSLDADFVGGVGGSLIVQ